MRKPFLRGKIFYAILTKDTKTVWRSLETSDESVAWERFRALKSECAPAKRMMVSEYFESYLERKAIDYSSKTLIMYRQTFRDYLRLCGDKGLKNVTPIDAEIFRSRRAREGVSKPTVNIDLKELKKAFGDAERLKLIEESPFSAVRPLKVEETDAVSFTESDLITLLSVIPDLEFRNLVMVTYLLAARRGEIVNLRWDWIDFENKLICVQNCGDFRVKGGKRRWVPMNQWVVEYLRGKERNGPYVFPDRNGLRRNGGSVSQRFKRFVKKTSLDQRLHFHSLRHSGITFYISRGVPEPFVQRMVGHSSLRVTRGYTHLESQTILLAINPLSPPKMN